MFSQKDFSAVKFLLPIYLIWALAIVIVSLIGLSLFPQYSSEDKFYFHRWANWDGGHFIGIAEAGYKESQTAFFPLYPILIKSLMFLGIGSLYASLLLSAISGFLGIFFLYKLLKLDFPDNFVRKSIFLLLIYPLSFIFLAAYSESLFFALSIGAFYFARSRKWKIAYILAGLSAVTRLIGIAVIIAIFVEKFIGDSQSFSIKKISFRSFLIFCLSFIPLISYSLYLNFIGKGYLSFLFDELYWGRKPTLFWNTIINSAHSLFAGFKINNLQELLYLINIIFLFFFITLFILFYKQLRKSYRIYYLLSLIIPLSSGSVASIPRFMLVVFPIFIVLAAVKNKIFNFAWRVVSVILLFFFLILYINGFSID